MKKLFTWLRCHLLNDHNWTSKANEGIKPTKEELAGGIHAFNFYARMYCKDCGKESRLNSRLK